MFRGAPPAPAPATGTPGGGVDRGILGYLLSEPVQHYMGEKYGPGVGFATGVAGAYLGYLTRGFGGSSPLTWSNSIITAAKLMGGYYMGKTMEEQNRDLIVPPGQVQTPPAAMGYMWGGEPTTGTASALAPPPNPSQ